MAPCTEKICDHMATVNYYSWNMVSLSKVKGSSLSTSLPLEDRDHIIKGSVWTRWDGADSTRVMAWESEDVGHTTCERACNVNGWSGSTEHMTSE